MQIHVFHVASGAPVVAILRTGKTPKGGEVATIVKRGLLRRGTHDTITHDDLIEIALRSGLTREQLEAAIDEEATEGDMERAREKWLQSRRARFHRHLRSYVIVIGGLLLINLMTRGSAWVLWPMIGWGIGLAFDASNTYFMSPGRIERGAKWMLKREKLGKRFKEEYMPDGL